MVKINHPGADRRTMPRPNRLDAAVNRVGRRKIPDALIMHVGVHPLQESQWSVRAAARTQFDRAPRVDFHVPELANRRTRLSGLGAIRVAECAAPPRSVGVLAQASATIARENGTHPSASDLVDSHNYKVIVLARSAHEATESGAHTLRAVHDVPAGGAVAMIPGTRKSRA